jgi:hypothetical protein
MARALGVDCNIFSGVNCNGVTKWEKSEREKDGRYAFWSVAMVPSGLYAVENASHYVSTVKTVILMTSI